MWWMLAASAWSAQCETIGMADVLEVTPPAVVVLGDRHGMFPDEGRATRIMRQLARRAPTVVALEAVPGDAQAVLDRYDQGQLLVTEVPEALDWEQTSQWPFDPYEGLFAAAYEEGVRLVAAGLPIEIPGQEELFPVPGGYMSVLHDALGEGEMPLPAQSGFLRSVAWRDYRIAQQALDGWDGQGYLIILADRLHVEGGKGVAWQVGLLSHVPVHSFVLAWGNDPPCFPGDRVWTPGLSEKLAGAQKPPPQPE